MLFQNLVSGMMIDTFSGLKEEDAERDEDKNNKCYICSMTKAEVLFYLIFRCKNRERPSINTKKSICFGTICFINIV
jgi:hypothetical protein